MDSATSAPNQENAGQPEPQTLVPRSASTAAGTAETTEALPAKNGEPQHHRVYRPSHRATFIGLAVVTVILLINAIIIGLVIRNQNNTAQPPTGQVTVNQAALDRLGVNQSAVSGAGVQLTITPNTNFKGDVVVGGDIQAAGQLKLNGAFLASSARFTTLDAGDTSLNTLGVSGNSTLANLIVPTSLNVSGTTRLQGAVTVTQLFTVNNSANISGNLAVGAALSAGSLSAGTITAVSNLVVGGHVITSGTAPTVVKGSSSVLGSNGTASISGNDQAGTIAFSVGVGSSSGGLAATVTFHSAYSSTPHVVITPIGQVGTFYISRSSSGFSVYVGSALAPGGYAFDYIVEQ